MLICCPLTDFCFWGAIIIVTVKSFTKIKEESLKVARAVIKIDLRGDTLKTLNES